MMQGEWFGNDAGEWYRNEAVDGVMEMATFYLTCMATSLSAITSLCLSSR